MSEEKEKIKIWLKKRQNLVLILILVLAFLIRLYYLFYTQGQTLWWDEAEYMATAKKWAFDIPYNDNEQRPPLFQLLGASLLIAGFKENFLKLFLVLLPSVFSIYLIFHLGKNLFNFKIGLMAAAASSLMWSYLFWSARFQPDFLSLSFQLLALINFWALFKEDKKKSAVYAGLFSALGFYFKISALLVPLSVLFFSLFKDGLSILKKKNYWITIAVFILTLMPFMVWQYFSFGNPLAFAPSYIEGTGVGQGWDFGWMTLKYFYIFPKILFFVLFLLGVLINMSDLFIKFDFLMKNRDKRTDPRIFSLAVLIVTTLFYIFYIRGIIEDRWVFLLVPFIFYFAAEGISRFENKINRNYFLALIIILFVIFSYAQIKHADTLIEMKKDSYSQVKESSLWIKDNSLKGDKVLSNSYTQATAYAEREILPYPALLKENSTGSYSYVPSTSSYIDDLIENERPRYLVVSIFEKHPDWTNQWLTNNTHILKPVQVYFMDEAQQQPALVVYEIVYQ